MKIMIDIGHPAHVHYFRNFIKIMEAKGHLFSVIARDKEVTFSLLSSYGIPYTSRGKGKTGFLGKILYIFKGDWIIFKKAVRFNPDIFLSFGSSYAAHIAFLFRKPHITFDDTEHATLEHLMCFPFSSVILTPDSYLKDLGKKQVRFSGFIELSSLHHKYFSPDACLLKKIGLNPEEKFAILRFVSWEASHDFGVKGIDINAKIHLVNELSKYLKVYISSEGKLPEELEEYKITVTPDKIHHVLAFATLYIGEGATMASECAMLGTPAIYFNNLDAGTLKEQAEYGLLMNLRNGDDLANKTLSIINTPKLEEVWKERHQKMLADKIDVTAFMVWFVENYPRSFKLMKENPGESQKQFRCN